MIIQQNITLIIGLCNLQEQGKTKCSAYWPNPKKDELKNMKSDIRIEQPEKDEYIGKYVVERKLEALTPDRQKLLVRQIHFTGWPDHGTPTKTMSDF
jgi:protein tyrosine phosphatase